ncbi:MAG: phosphatidate cytidylyltransferase [Nitrospirae bacterium]|nr:phosphatidate cytidylyltransferase [Nitrospirota bacterium]
MQLKRLLVAALLLPPFYFAIMKLPELYFFLLLLALSAAAQWEFYSMYRIGGLMKISGICFGAIVLVATDVSRNSFPHVLMLSFMGILCLRLFAKKDPSSSLREISPFVLGLLYIPGLLAFQLFLRDNGPQWIIFLFGCVWISDSLALYVGKALGRRKLYEEVSPHKTVAGALGSVVGGGLAGWLLNLLLIHTMSAGKAVGIGLVLGAVTIVGDLLESMFKRDAGVKDSSALIPGHGGVLDKIDGVLFAGPVLYWVSAATGVIA